MRGIRATESQHKKLAKQNVGNGIIIWKSSENTTTECEFFTKDGELYDLVSGKPLSLEYGKMGVTKYINKPEPEVS